MEQYSDSAIHYLAKVDQITPGYRSTHSNLGMCYLKIEKYNEAVRYFNRAIKQENKNGHHYFYAGYCKVKLGKINEGCIEINTASKLGFKGANELIKQYCR